MDITVPKRSLEEAKQFFKIDPEKKQILMMPGSRKQEIEKLLPPMVEAAKILLKSDSKLEFFLPLASTISESMIQEIADLLANVNWRGVVAGVGIHRRRDDPGDAVDHDLADRGIEH